MRRVISMEPSKTRGEFLHPLLLFTTTIHAVAEPGWHLAMRVEEIIAASGRIAE
ncbi:MAG: hypothetical protein ACK5TQ_10660 [Acetobacteraceae bacterium]